MQEFYKIPQEHDVVSAQNILYNLHDAELVTLEASYGQGLSALIIVYNSHDPWLVTLEDSRNFCTGGLRNGDFGGKPSCNTFIQMTLHIII
jgi:hypothetical protein